MKSRILAIDLAKDIFEIAVAEQHHQIIDRKRLNRSQLTTFIHKQPPAQVVMEACGTAHYWARYLMEQGHEVRLLPAQYVKPYRRRNKTDRADCEALIEANRCGEIKPVPVRSVEQQQIQQLHRVREQYKRTRTSRINMLRGFLRELGYPIGLSPATVMRRVPQILENEAIPVALIRVYQSCLDEIKQLAEQMKVIERELHQLTRHNEAIARVRQIAGVGLLTSTALVSAAGSAHYYKSGRHFAAWLGLTPKEYSSGNTRRLGRISKQGDRYGRMLIIHGARSVLARAKRLTVAEPKQLTHLHRWAVQLEQRVGHNKATVALANKLARIFWATWKYEREFNGNYSERFA